LSAIVSNLYFFDPQKTGKGGIKLKSI